MKTLQQLRAERTCLLGSWEYAFAMGAGCTYGPDNDLTRSVLVRLRNLDARIAEHES